MFVGKCVLGTVARGVVEVAEEYGVTVCSKVSENVHVSRTKRHR